jgi:hypothetical protein
MVGKYLLLHLLHSLLHRLFIQPSESFELLEGILITPPL